MKKITHCVTFMLDRINVMRYLHPINNTGVMMQPDYEISARTQAAPVYYYDECDSDYDVVEGFQRYFADFMSMHNRSPVDWEECFTGRPDEEAHIVWCMYELLNDAAAFNEAKDRISKLRGRDVSLFVQESEERAFLEEWLPRVESKKPRVRKADRLPVTPTEHERED